MAVMMTEIGARVYKPMGTIYTRSYSGFGPKREAIDTRSYSGFGPKRETSEIDTFDHPLGKFGFCNVNDMGWIGILLTVWMIVVP